MWCCIPTPLVDAISSFATCPFRVTNLARPFPRCSTCTYVCADAFRFLEAGTALRLSPNDVNVAVRIVERLALPAPSASLGYGSSSKAGLRSASAVADWPSTVIPVLDDEAFGICGDNQWLQRDILRQQFGTGGTADDIAANDGVRQAPSEERFESIGVDFGASECDSSGYGVLSTEQRDGAHEREPVSKPSLCLVMGDALGADLLRWCTVICRSPEWRSIFAGESGVAQQLEAMAPPSRDGDSVAGTKRSVQDMGQVSTTEKTTEDSSACIPDAVFSPPTASADTMDEKSAACGGSDVSEQTKNSVSDGNEKAHGLAQLLHVVTKVVHTVKEHVRALGAARDRVGAVTLIGDLGGKVLEAGGERSFDLCKRETSDAVQTIVGALADAVLDAFADHMADPTVHRHIRQSISKQVCEGEGTSNYAPQVPEAAAAAGTTAAESTPAFPPRGAVKAMSEIAPVIDGSSSADTAGLSVDLVSDVAWLFSALEPEAEKGSASGGARAGPAAANLSSAMSCWASGRILACMPGRGQLEYALGLAPAPDDGNPGSGSDKGLSSTPAAVAAPSVRPLPARLACFAVRTLLENAQVAREAGPDSAVPREPCMPRAQPSSCYGGESLAARACIGRSSAFYRVALIAEQMPAWRLRPTQKQSGTDEQAPFVEDEYIEAASAIAGRAAAVEVLDALTGVLCVAAAHERLMAAKRLHAEAAGAQRKPTGYTVGSVGTVIGPALHAISVLLSTGGGGGSSPGSAGSAASLRSSLLARVKKRRTGSFDNSVGDNAAQGLPSASGVSDARWRSLAGLQLCASLDRVHVAALLLCWEPWHPWMEKDIPSICGTSKAAPMPLRQSRSWQFFLSLVNDLAQACVASRQDPLQAKGLAALIIRTVVSFKASTGDSVNLVPFLDMPAVLFLSKVRRFVEG